MVRVYEKKAKQILVRTKIPSADWVANPYSGCTAGCVYCYARFVCRWRAENEVWGDFVDVKINAPELATKESLKKTGIVFLSSVSDPYQPLEKKYRLTREILEGLNKKLGLRILTKFDLVLRDIEILKKFKDCEVGLTITTLDEEIQKKFEPRATSPLERLNTLKKLKAEGIKTYAFIGPILPHLTDLKEIVKKISPYVDSFKFEDLNMSPCKNDVLRVINEHYPELREKYNNLDKKFWIERKNEIESLVKKYSKPHSIFFKSLGATKG